MTTDKYDPISALAELVRAAFDYNTIDSYHYAEQVAERLELVEFEDDKDGRPFLPDAETVAEVLRKALGLDVAMAVAVKEVPSVSQVRSWLQSHGWKLRGAGQAGEAWNPPSGDAWVGVPGDDGDDPAFLASQIARIADREGRDADEVRLEMLEVPGE